MAGDTCVSAQGMAAIVGRDERYHLCGSAHGFHDAGELIRKHQAEVLLIEPFLEDRDGILWIKELAKEYPQTRILVVSRQSERIYAERVLQAGATGYWMKNGSPEELSVPSKPWPPVKCLSVHETALAMDKFGHPGSRRQELDVLSDRELAVFALIAAEQSVGRMAKTLGISRTTVETHCQHIKLKLGYPNAEALKRGAREILGRPRA